MSLKQITYVLPDANFFSRHSGRVTHAIGIISGLIKNDVYINLFSEERVNSYIENNNTLSLNTLSGGDELSFFSRIIFTFRLLTLSISNTEKNHPILIRKTVLSLIYFFMNLNNNKDCHIFWEVNGLGLQRWKGKPIRGLVFNIILLFNKYILRKSSGVYVVNNELKESLTKGYFAVSKDKVIVLTNGGPEPFNKVRIASPDEISFIYFGMFQDYNEFDKVIKAFNFYNKKFKNSNLYIIGSGKLENLIYSLSKNLNNINVLKSMSYIELTKMKFLETRCVGLIPLKNFYASSILSPIKMFDYMSLGMPIIHSDSVNFSGYKINHSSCKVYESGDVDSLIEAMIEIDEVKELNEWEELMSIAFKNAENNTWQGKMKILMNFIMN